jgi:hypothetical protein
MNKMMRPLVRRKERMFLTGGQSEEDNDCSKSKEKSGAKVKRKSSIGVTVGIVTWVGVVVILLRVSSSSGLISQRGLDLTFCPHAGKKEECEGES